METTKLSVRIRRARPEEANPLSELILRAKAHWGYDPSWLAVWRSDLALAYDVIARDPVFCAEESDSGRIVGVSHLYRLKDGELYLDHLFVEPAAMGRGVGAQLWRHAVEYAATQGLRSVVFDADPNARPFYERMGAVVVGWELSPVVPGRRTPLMRYDLPKG